MKISLRSFLTSNFFKNENNFCLHFAINENSYEIESSKLLDYKYVQYIAFDDNHCFKLTTITTTLGKFLTKFSDLSNSEITHICEKTKSIMLNYGVFKIVEGDEIKEKYYYKSTVPNNGTLSNSCMRHKFCQDKNFFQIYADNAKMLILIPNRGKRVLGRAILWKYKDTYMMDRVYTAEEYMKHKFYEYAKQQGWYILNENRFVYAGNIQEWLSPKSNYKRVVHPKVTIKLKSEYRFYPFLDSFCYLTADRTKLTTDPTKGSFILHSTKGFKQRYDYKDYN